MDFDQDDNAIFIIMAKPNGSLKKICLGKFDFEHSRCGIFGVTPLLFKPGMVDKVFECLEKQDWDVFQPIMCNARIRPYVKKYNKTKYGVTNPFKKEERDQNRH